jgi:hypothetical protein
MLGQRESGSIDPTTLSHETAARLLGKQANRIPLRYGNSFFATLTRIFRRDSPIADVNIPDLLYRLRGVEITLPPLRQRCDFLQIIHTLLASLGTECSISDDAIHVVRQYPWPGNFRELKNFLLPMILVANSSVLLPSDVSRVFNLSLAGIFLPLLGYRINAKREIYIAALAWPEA